MPATRLLGATCAAIVLLLPASASATVAYTQTAGVYVAHDDGTAAHRVSGTYRGVVDGITPDGGRVLYSMYNGGHSFTSTLHVAPVAGGARRTLLHRRNGDLFALSPNGRFVAALSGRHGARLSLMVIDVASGSHRTLARGRFEEFDGASFSPDSTQLVYGRGTSLYVSAITGGPARRVVTHGGAPVWGPSLIAYAHLVTAGRYTHRNVWLVDPDGTGPHALTHDAIGSYDDGIEPRGWSADGARLLAQYSGSDDYGIVVDTATGREHRFPRGAGLYLQAISKDGQTVLGYQGAVLGHPDSEVVTRPATGGPPKVLARHAALAAWTL